MDNLDLLVPEKVRWSERLVNSDQSRNKIIKELKYELKEEIYKKWCIEQIKECHDISSNVIIMSHEILYREYTINTNTNATEYERRIDEIVHGILYLDALHPVQTILPNIKDNFGCMVRFVEIVCNFQLSDHLPPYKAIYIKDRINPSNDYLQGEIVTVLIKCFFTTGTGYRRTVRNGLQQPRNGNEPPSTSIHIELCSGFSYTCEFRITNENFLLCFVWKGNIRQRQSEFTYVDSSSPNFHQKSIWL